MSSVFLRYLSLWKSFRSIPATIPLPLRKVAALLAESVAVFAAECWSACQRNPGRLPTGMLADFDRIHQQVAIIRPGPIVGQMLHPFLRLLPLRLLPLLRPSACPLS